ncbi:MAG: ABC transporter ATP-binding protein [Gammaproteobacteria bacterium]|jgi:ABC-2 type transport system ATP-binding protein
MKALEIKNLTKTYKNKVEALRGIDLSVERGDFFALLGPNGAGKSTTIGIIASLVNKTSGSVSICGTDVDEDFPLAKSKLGVVNQEFNFSQFEKVINVITAQAGYYGVDFKTATEKAESYLKKLGIWDKRNSIVRELSGGQKRRVMIIKALIHEPELLILDEPTAGVDIELRRSLWDFLIDINKAGTTIILTTHYLEEAENLCRNIAIIDEGQIIENTKMSNLLQQLENQVFLIETNSKLPENFSIEGFDTQVLDENKFSVIVPKDVTINDLFDKSELGTIEVANMKNQTNRLEELFLNLTAK